MSATALNPPRTLAARLPFYYGWVMVVLAAVAMTATLPGRTHGLGFIAAELEKDPALGLGELAFAQFNLWAILLGSVFCLPVGRLIDRFGVRVVLTAVYLGLGAAVLGMSAAADWLTFFLCLTLVRGLGQGSLSIVSMAMIGKWFTRRLGIAMGVFTLLLTIGFIASSGMIDAVGAYGWRPTWAALGFTLLGLGVVGWLLVRSTPESVGLAVEQATVATPASTGDDWPLAQALRLPAFWAFALGVALFNLVWSAITLNNERLLAGQGFGQLPEGGTDPAALKATYRNVMMMLVFAGLPANLLCGWLASRWPMGRLLLPGMLVFAMSLAAFPFVREQGHALGYGLALGFAGGVITVIFFAFAGKAFGRTHLGLIQGALQVISVLASAVGPLLLALCKEATAGILGSSSRRRLWRSCWGLPPGCCPFRGPGRRHDDQVSPVAERGRPRPVDRVLPDPLRP